MVLAAALITYISYQFLFVFLPDFHEIEEGRGAVNMLAYFLRIVFVYASTCTYLFLFRTFAVNPGYIPQWLKLTKNSDGTGPVRVVRIYNMRTWMANGIYSFD